MVIGVSSESPVTIVSVPVRHDGAVAYAAGLEAVTGAEPTVPFSFKRVGGESSLKFDAQPMTQYFTQRALEIEQARVEDMQAALVEKQRLRRDVAQIKLAYAERNRKAELRDEAVRRDAKSKAEVMAAAWLLEQARLEAEAKAQAEAQAKAEADAKAVAYAKVKADAEAQKALDAAKAIQSPPP